MAFTYALYYPWIGIRNTTWLKNAVLYWDKISTIVPIDFDQPYESVEETELVHAGILIPHYVNPGDETVRDASRNFSQYINTPEAENVLSEGRGLNDQEASPTRDRQFSRISRMKMDEDLAQELLSFESVHENGDWLIFDRQVANYYMSLLAANISRKFHRAPLTDELLFDSLTNRVIRGDQPAMSAQRIGEALLAKVALQSISIDPETPIEEIIRFRDAHSDELGRFRSVIGTLSQKIGTDIQSLEALQQWVDDIYKNEISPAVNGLKDALRRARIRNFVVYLTSFIFAGSINYLVPNTPINLLTYAGCTIAAKTINFSLDRRAQLAENPYSFVLSMERSVN